MASEITAVKIGKEFICVHPSFDHIEATLPPHRFTLRRRPDKKCDRENVEKRSQKALAGK